jgi:predicted AAA+ superfamily ATPase
MAAALEQFLVRAEACWRAWRRSCRRPRRGRLGAWPCFPLAQAQQRRQLSAGGGACVPIALDDLQHIGPQKEQIEQNTRQFVPASRPTTCC